MCVGVSVGGSRAKQNVCEFAQPSVKSLLIIHDGVWGGGTFREMMAMRRKK